ncbi:MAG: LytTR family transcriptional regulator DNA-binding domain-containing protein, partial [Bacteroidales bacterium]|nr:LytTR family transcriptional regulator DNA-binding domain-containing protein [Bacteroidales bacterium]
MVYRDMWKLDVTDKDSNIQFVSIDDIFYCQQQRNFTAVYTVQNKCYTRLGSMKHLEQLFGEEEFIRITTTLLVPFRYIQSCQDNVVVMKRMPWEKEPTTFQL